MTLSDPFWPHGLQHARPPCPSPTPRVYSNSCLLSRWCHPTISSSVIPFSSCLRSFPASGSFPMSQLFASGAQSTEVSALASFLPKKSQGWSPSEWTDWTFLQSKGLSRVFSSTTVQKHQFFSAELSSQSNSHIHTWVLITLNDTTIISPSPQGILSKILNGCLNLQIALNLYILFFCYAEKDEGSTQKDGENKWETIILCLQLQLSMLFWTHSQALKVISHRQLLF